MVRLRVDLNELSIKNLSKDVPLGKYKIMRPWRV